MVSFSLAEIVTKDKLVHQGIFFRPSHPSKKAVLWVHGLTGRFYGDVELMSLWAQTCEQKGFGFAAFNNRGHDIVAGLRKLDTRKKTGYRHATYGAGLERFSDCVLDIDAAISFLMSQGFAQVVLIGHSTGANKVCYYAATKKDPRVVGVVLAGPMSDRYSRNTDKVHYRKNMAFMQKLVKQRKGDEILGGRHFFPMTPKRWLSLLAPGSKEDVFNYGDKKNVLSAFAKIRKPLLIVLSELDETADRPIEEIKQAFDTHTKSPSYKSVIIPGATHSYTGKEKEFVREVVSWSSSL
jgi:alpha-beta hydrolase superfamily lysophospholipase